MLALSTFISSVDSDEKKVRLLLSALAPSVRYYDEATQELTLSGTLCVLLFDFLLVVGHAVEDAVPMTVAVAPNVAEYGVLLAAALEKDSPQIPVGFMTLVDNRYMLVQGAGVDASSRVYDSQEGTWQAKLVVPPVCSLTVSLPAIYLNSVAAFTPHQRFAHAFKAGRINLATKEAPGV